MERDRIYERLTGILREVFDNDEVLATPELTAEKVAGWDSFGHLRFLFAVEKSFGIKFASSQMSSLRNVGELVDVIDSKLPA